MKNMIKIFSGILVIAIAVIAFNCSGGSNDSTETTDSTAVQVDTTEVSGGAGLDSATAPIK